MTGLMECRGCRRYHVDEDGVGRCCYIPPPIVGIAASVALPPVAPDYYCSEWTEAK